MYACGIGVNIFQTHANIGECPVWPRSRLTTATHSSRCLEAFHYSSALSGWWSIGTWSNLFQIWSDSI